VPHSFSLWPTLKLVLRERCPWPYFGCELSHSPFIRTHDDHGLVSCEHHSFAFSFPLKIFCLPPNHERIPLFCSFFESQAHQSTLQRMSDRDTATMLGCKMKSVWDTIRGPSGFSFSFHVPESKSFAYAALFRRCLLSCVLSPLFNLTSLAVRSKPNGPRNLIKKNKQKNSLCFSFFLPLDPRSFALFRLCLRQSAHPRTTK
jgi:hypothetical protein